MGGGLGVVEEAAWGFGAVMTFCSSIGVAFGPRFGVYYRAESVLAFVGFGSCYLYF